MAPVEHDMTMNARLLSRSLFAQTRAATDEADEAACTEALHCYREQEN